MSEEKKKTLSCVFLTDVSCSFRKSESFGIMDRCFKCEHYREFERVMEQEEEAFFEEVERIEKYGYPKSFKEFEK